MEVKERYNISPTTTIHLIHDDDREFSEMTSSMNSDASNDMDLVKHHDGRISTSLCLGKPSFQKSSVFLNIVQKAFDPPPPFYLNICPILQGVFFKRFFEH